MGAALEGVGADGTLEGAGSGFALEGVEADGTLEGVEAGFALEGVEAVGTLEGAGAEFALEGVGAVGYNMVVVVGCLMAVTQLCVLEVAALVGRAEQLAAVVDFVGQVNSSLAA